MLRKRSAIRPGYATRNATHSARSVRCTFLNEGSGGRRQEADKKFNEIAGHVFVRKKGAKPRAYLKSINRIKQTECSIDSSA